jgi:hypothetical protein
MATESVTRLFDRRTAMKMVAVWAAVLGMSLAASGSALAIPLTEVGAVDTLLAQAALPNSGEATEEAWVESVLGFDVEMTFKLDESGTWLGVDDTPNTFALALETSAEYFLLKTGNLASVSNPDNPNTHFLFDNAEVMAWAVVDFTDMGYTPLVTKVKKVSHVVEFNETSQVPEPGTLLLLGSGLCGLALMRRRRQ